MALTQAMNMLKNKQANKPGIYTSSYSDQISALMDKINNREKFEYYFNADPLYQQYKNQYTNLGKLDLLLLRIYLINLGIELLWQLNRTGTDVILTLKYQLIFC